ncbi:unnamed protein product [Allacma fusca]|uniref:Uncharacterized protein n=1 Tax=Allacma fusca TaxID=39272 RepID=A0A8J2K2R6_9HEXA|nr:unnamed protein product [Allacma fusca]
MVLMCKMVQELFRQMENFVSDKSWPEIDSIRRKEPYFHSYSEEMARVDPQHSRALISKEFDLARFMDFILNSLYPLIAFSRLYIKTAMAEAIIHEESLVAKEIVGICLKSRSLDKPTRMELNMIYQELTQTPTKITLGKYATLDTGLFLRIINQYVTYLIVLLQFAGGTNQRKDRCTKFNLFRDFLEYARTLDQDLSIFIYLVSTMAVLLCLLLCLAAEGTRQLKRDSLFGESIFDESVINSKNDEFIPVENFPNIFELFNEPMANNSDIPSVEYHDESLESSEERKEPTESVFLEETTTESYISAKPLVRDQLTQENIKSKINQQLKQRFRPMRKNKKSGRSKSSKNGAQADQLQGDGTSPIAKAYGKPGEPFGGPRKPYHFAYSVKNKYGNNFNQEETSDGNTITGQYRVLLPDGRLQTVVYIADWKHGYNAVVTYEGESKQDDQYEVPKFPKPTPAIPKALIYRPIIEKPTIVDPSSIGPINNNNAFNFPTFTQPILNHPGIVQSIQQDHQVPSQPPSIPQPIVNHQSVVHIPAYHTQQDKPFRPSPPDKSSWQPMQPNYGFPVQQALVGPQPVIPLPHSNNHGGKSLYNPGHVVFQHHNYKINHPTPGGYSQVHYRQTIESSSGYDVDDDYDRQNVRYAHQFPGIPLQPFSPQYVIQGHVLTSKVPHPNQGFLSSESQKSVQLSPAEKMQSYSNKNSPDDKPMFDAHINDQGLINSKLAGHINNLPFIRRPVSGAGNNPQSLGSALFFRPNFTLINHGKFKSGPAEFLPVQQNQQLHSQLSGQMPTPTVTTFPHPHINLVSSNGIFKSELKNQSKAHVTTVAKPESVTQAESLQHNVYRKHSESTSKLKNATFGISGVTPSQNVNKVSYNATHSLIPLPKDFIAKSIYAHINSLRRGNPIPAESVLKSIVENAASPVINPGLNGLSPVTTPMPKYKSLRFSRGQSSSFKIGRSTDVVHESQIPSTMTPFLENLDENETTAFSTTTITPNNNGAMTEQELELLQLPLNKTETATPGMDLHVNTSMSAGTAAKGTVVVINARDNYTKIKRVRYRNRKSNSNGTII